MSFLSHVARFSGLRLCVVTVGLVLARPAAADTYYWNAPSGTDWTAPNAWLLNSPTGPPATWVDHNAAVFAAGGVPTNFAVSTAVTATSIEFNYPSVMTVTAAGGSLTVVGNTAAIGVISVGSTG